MSDSPDTMHDRLRYRSGNVVSNFRNRSERSRLANQIRSYPLFRPPHVTVPNRLTAEQANENHCALMDAAEYRTEVIQQLLSSFGVTLSVENPTIDSIRSLDAWAYQQWPGIFDQKLWLQISCTYTFELSDKNLAIRCLLLDLSLLLGNCYRAVNREAQWMLDNRPGTIEDETTTAHRTVIETQLQADGVIRGPDVIDPESHVLSHYGFQKTDNPTLMLNQRMGQILGEPVSRLLELI